MSYFERALEADRIEMPECRCGKEMQLQRIEPAPDRRKAWALCCCLACQHEIRLTVWAADVVN